MSSLPYGEPHLLVQWPRGITGWLWLPQCRVGSPGGLGEEGFQELHEGDSLLRALHPSGFPEKLKLPDLFITKPLAGTNSRIEFNNIVLFSLSFIFTFIFYSWHRDLHFPLTVLI